MSILLKMLGSVLRQRIKNYPLPQVDLMPVYTCQICGGEAKPFDRLDFNKSCEEANGKYLPASGAQIDYYRCESCGFCFAPAFLSWTRDDFIKHIYNADYIRVDPEYKKIRPYNNAQLLNSLLGGEKHRISHLDYGGGSGVLSRELRRLGWQSESYDPFVAKGIERSELGTYDLVTAYEVFEHVPDVNALVADLAALTKPGGMILFTTVLSDDYIRVPQRLGWWYAAPRNGHVSLFSAASLTKLFEKVNMRQTSYSVDAHAAYRVLPDWAELLK